MWPQDSPHGAVQLRFENADRPWHTAPLHDPRRSGRNASNSGALFFIETEDKTPGRVLSHLQDEAAPFVVGKAFGRRKRNAVLPWPDAQRAHCRERQISSGERVSKEIGAAVCKPSGDRVHRLANHRIGLDQSRPVLPGIAFEEGRRHRPGDAEHYVLPSRSAARVVGQAVLEGAKELIVRDAPRLFTEAPSELILQGFNLGPCGPVGVKRHGRPFRRPADDLSRAVQCPVVAHEYRHGLRPARCFGNASSHELQVLVFVVVDPGVIESPASTLAIVAQRNRDEPRTHSGTLLPAAALTD